MTKSDLIEAVAKELGVGENDARVVVDTFLDGLVGALGRAERVELRGFGTFGVRRRRPRVGRNPRSGERVHVPAKTVPFFKPGRILKISLGLGKPGAKSTLRPGAK
jgi:nucleoid DNA-binding protein